MRGNLKDSDGYRLLYGSIPAGAGEPGEAKTTLACEWVYPRGCGGTMTTISFTIGKTGLSPRVRGNRLRLKASAECDGSIPAGAGEPTRHRWLGIPLWVYPRGCGGTSDSAINEIRNQGLSPRVRGNLVHSSLCGFDYGSIPAGAGEPFGVGIPMPVKTVYPRGCGGTLLPRWQGTSSKGLSPRVRGNPEAKSNIRHGHEGLSPRVRGNHNLVGVSLGNRGSIPAGAGEPRLLVCHKR